MLRRKYSDYNDFKPESARDVMLKSYLNIIPPLEHQTNISTWDQLTLNQIDSKHL